jgi:ABC-type sugar transport system ATPase subunit
MASKIRAENISKSYGSVQALENVDFEVRDGEIMALVGDNAAGKSTLIHILSGVLSRDSGTINIDGEVVELESYNDARSHGIETVYQDLSLSKKQSVGANIYLGHEPVRDDIWGRLLGAVDRSLIRSGSREALERVKMDIDPDEPVTALSGGQQQAVAIARALSSDPDILILDEPTSALSIEGTRDILDVIEGLKEEGITIVFISHNLDVVFEVADRMSVLAHGEMMGVRETATTEREELVQMMMGLEASADEEGVTL